MAILVPRTSHDQRLMIDFKGQQATTDLSLYSEGMTSVGDTSFVTEGIEFDGNNDSVIHTTADLTVLNDIVFETWVEPDTNEQQYVGGLYDTGTSRLLFGLDSSGRVYINDDLSNGNTDIHSANTQYTIDTFYHLVYRINGSRKRAYINGVEVIDSFGSGNDLSAMSTSQVMIGAGDDVGNTDFNGVISTVNVWFSDMIASQIQQRYVLGRGFFTIEPTKQLLFHEQFNDQQILDDWVINSGTFMVEYDATTNKKHYLTCLTDGNLQQETPNWNGGDFSDTSTTVGGSPTVTRNTSNITLTMTAGDGITDIVVRRN